MCFGVDGHQDIDVTAAGGIDGAADINAADEDGIGILSWSLNSIMSVEPSSRQ